MGSENRADQAWDFLSNWFTSGFLFGEVQCNTWLLEHLSVDFICPVKPSTDSHSFAESTLQGVLVG